jgi:hypothetical protein
MTSGRFVKMYRFAHCEMYGGLGLSDQPFADDLRDEEGLVDAELKPSSDSHHRDSLASSRIPHW